MDLSAILVDEKFLPAAIDMISNAKGLICISTFKAEVTTKPRGRKLRKFFELLFEKARQGVETRFLINRVGQISAVPMSNLYVMREVPKFGIEIRYLPGLRICHAKLLIVDSMTAILGSHNLSVRSCHNNFEVSYNVRNPLDVMSLQRTFNGAWGSARKV